VAKRRNPAKRSARARQDAALKVEVRRVFDQNFSVYGVRKAGASSSAKASMLPVAQYRD
jgi:hypothetical protein